MKITLDSNPSDAPCCVKIIAKDGRDVLIQQDWEWPGVASTFGWSMKDCTPEEPEFYTEDWKTDPAIDAEYVSAYGRYERQAMCEHEGTDGTIDCPSCGMKAAEFIAQARQFLDDNDGAEAEDPGYFES